jgi:diguanylate cyclase (GGDEF)-like protein
VSGALLFLGGAIVGAAAGFIVARKAGSARQLSVPAPLPEDLLASDTATHFAEDLAGESSFEPLAYALVERCATRVGLPAAIVMREQVGGAVFIKAVAGGLDGRMLGMEVPLDSPAGRAVTGGKPVIGAPDEKVVSISRGDRRRYQGGGVSVPIAQGGRVYGAVIVFGEAPSGAQGAVDALAREVRKFAPVIIPAYAAAQAAQRAETDELTGLPNRRGLKGAMARAAGTDAAALIALDVDYFKAVNDTFGHEAGDAALRHIARLLLEAVRPKDTAARIGGEEFAIWLPGADIKAGQEIAERVRASVEAAPFRRAGSEQPITISCGVAAYPHPIKAKDGLMGAADAALYTAKREGRNRVVASMDRAG